MIIERDLKFPSLPSTPGRVGAVDPVRDEAVGPAGPTTATRMDKFTDLMLEKTGLFAMVGKAERGPAAIGDVVGDIRCLQADAF